MAKSSEGVKMAVNNRRARHDYFLDDRHEAGMSLVGTEVKSLREGRGSLAEAWIRLDNDTGEAWLEQAHIPEYAYGNRNNHFPTRPRKLLLHRHELDQLGKSVATKGVTLVPTRIYFKHGRAKLEFFLGKGKNVADKRRDVAARDAQRQVERALKDRRR
ncbi:SsrA-binding protein SmpB [Salsipaludibacter albus]|uniref:SsrA-binding protein SmpB n=1 Tax=Salsipaludibacter albus TaxID=2849650 RepID=UPI002367A83E|nr:SsrA-binding protein SmpB [Salsipaludibacter albus]MBY5162798.1 SsrA-binding protein SmpB [Salsipaludibacter albus]